VFDVKENFIISGEEYNNENMTIVIRQFQQTDQDIVKALILQGLGEHFGRIDPTLNLDLNDINQSYIKAGHYFVVAETGGQIAATAALITETADTGRIVRVTVSPANRRSGIGRLLVEHLLETAVQKKLTAVLVETNHDWYDAIRLYERCGFSEYDRDDESVHFWKRMIGDW
jgi:N-acetylglutamate synthase-like GNAT family acetyltransferase